jgi:hypothetical protein
LLYCTNSVAVVIYFTFRQRIMKSLGVELRDGICCHFRILSAPVKGRLHIPLLQSRTYPPGGLCRLTSTRVNKTEPCNTRTLLGWPRKWLLDRPESSLIYSAKAIRVYSLTSCKVVSGYRKRTSERSVRSALLQRRQKG